MSRRQPANEQFGAESRPWNLAKSVALLIAVTVSAAATTWIIGGAAAKWWDDQSAPWIVGRASGMTGYLLLVALVATGLLLAHPWRYRWRVPSASLRIRIHVALASFTLVFVVLHVVVLATDSYAGVGILGALLPFGAQYRPAAVTLGVLGLYAGLAAGLTGMLAGGIASRVWWPIHKIAIVSLALIWGHSVWAGSDTPALLTTYLVTGAGVVALAVSRYTARTPADEATDLACTRPTATHFLHE